MKQNKNLIIHIFIIATLSFTGCHNTKTKAIVSTIDNLLQNKVDTLLATSMTEYQATSGKVIIMETATGYIKTMAELERKDTLSPFQPTSDFCTPYPTQQRQVATLLAALETNKVSLSDTIDVGRGIYITDGDTIKDHNRFRGGYGKITAERAVAVSSSVGEIKIRERAFSNSKSEYETAISQIGYGKPGSVKELSCIQTTDKITSRIAPIQLVAFYNAIANHGCMAQPQTYQDSVTIINPQIASKANIDSIRLVLERTVTEGLGKYAYTDKTKVAGRGGTMQIGSPETPTYVMDFCGYFPADNPRYTILVVLEKQELPASGHIHAAEVFRKIVEQLIQD